MTILTRGFRLTEVGPWCVKCFQREALEIFYELGVSNLALAEGHCLYAEQFRSLCERKWVANPSEQVPSRPKGMSARASWYSSVICNSTVADKDIVNIRELIRCPMASIGVLEPLHVASQRASYCHACAARTG